MAEHLEKTLHILCRLCQYVSPLIDGTLFAFRQVNAALIITGGDGEGVFSCCWNRLMY